jgi:hypothetical protein
VSSEDGLETIYKLKKNKVVLVTRGTKNELVHQIPIKKKSRKKNKLLKMFFFGIKNVLYLKNILFSGTNHEFVLEKVIFFTPFEYWT